MARDLKPGSALEIAKQQHKQRMPGVVSIEGSGTRVELAELIALRLRVPQAPRLHAATARASRAGGHASRLRGRGMDYLESRAYQAGDDVRHLDWRLTARSGQLHTKLFQEERERSLLLLLDCNASMYFATRRRFKSVQAARAAALAAWYAAQAGERVGVLAFGICRDIQRAEAGLRGALSVCGALVRWDQHSTPQKTGHATDETLGMALQRVWHLLQGASRILLVSDGQSCDDAAQARLLPLCRHSRVAVLTVADVLELSLPPAGRFPLEHDGRREICDLSSSVARRDFLHTLGAGPARLVQLSTALGLHHRVIDTCSDPLDAIGALLGQRLHRSA